MPDLMRAGHGNNAYGEPPIDVSRHGILVMLVLFLIAQWCLHADSCTACSPRDAGMCSQVSPLDLATTRGYGWKPQAGLIDVVVDTATRARIEPRLLLAVLLREGGDHHSFDWLAATEVGQVHHFSIGIANMQLPAFEQARAYAAGAIDFAWRDIGMDPVKAVRAAAFLLARRASELDPRRSRRLSDAEYLRVGYRAGPQIMGLTERTGRYPAGMVLFDLAYDTARRLLATPSIAGTTAHELGPTMRSNHDSVTCGRP